MKLIRIWDCERYCSNARALAARWNRFGIASPGFQELKARDMIKINRIGNKLGLAGLIGIALAVGMVANQSLTETSIARANRNADIEQQVSVNVLQSESQTRTMQLAYRGIRLAKTRAELEKNIGELQSARSEHEKHLDAALALAPKPESRE